MGGRNIELMEFTDFDFNDLKAGGITTVWLAQNIPVRPYRNGVLQVRFRSINLAAGTSVTFALVTVAPTAEDPARIYRATFAGVVTTYPATPLSIPGTITAGAGLLYTKELTTDSLPLPDFVSLRMVVTQGAAADLALDFTAAVAVALKE